MTKRAWLLGVLSACAAITGCGDDTGSDPGIEEVPALYAEAICDAFLSCLGPGTPKNLTREECLATNQAGIEDGDFQYLQDSVDAGRIRYNGGRVESCIADIATAPCEELGTGHAPVSCQQTFVGTIAAGDDCALDEECSGNAFCDTTGMTCPGTCTALGDAGADCTEDNQCAEGLACALPAIGLGSCTAQAGEGDPCGGNAPDCGLGMVCAGENEDQNISGVCKRIDEVFVAAIGEECSLDDGIFCVEGASCVATLTGTGVNAMVSWECEAERQADADCKLAIPDQCPAGQYCDVDPSAQLPRFTGTCKDLPRAGQECGKWQGVCDSGAVCDGAGLCQPINRIGGSCDDDTQCASENCVGGECAAPSLCSLGT